MLSMIGRAGPVRFIGGVSGPARFCWGDKRNREDSTAKPGLALSLVPIQPFILAHSGSKQSGYQTKGRIAISLSYPASMGCSPQKTLGRYWASQVDTIFRSDSEIARNQPPKLAPD